MPGTITCFSDPGIPGAGVRTAGKIQSFTLKSRKRGLKRKSKATVYISLELSFPSVSLKRIAEQRRNCLSVATPHGGESLVLTSSPSWIWEVCSMTGMYVARKSALSQSEFLRLFPRPLLHRLGGCKGRGGDA